MQVLFKPIVEEDVDQLRDLALNTFIDSYEHLNTPSNFDWYVQKAFTKDRLLSEIRNEESYYYFVALEDQVIGYLKLNIGDSQTEAHTENYLEIERIYLISKFQRQGFGRQMIDFVFDKARALSKPKVWLGVWDQNPSAIQFYERMGFQQNGSHIFKFGDEDQIDFIFEIEVSSK